MTVLGKFQVNAFLPAVLVALTAGSQFLARAQSTEDAHRAAAAVTETKAFTLEAREEALSQLQEVAKVFLSARAGTEAAKILCRIGRLQLTLNQPRSAIESHERALKQLPKRDNEVAVDNLNGLAEAYLRLNDDDRARAAVQQALATSKDLTYTKGEAQAELLLSEVQNNEDHVVALATAQRALALWNSNGDKAGIAKTYAQIGQTYLAQNLLAEAEQNYQVTLGIWHELNDAAGQAGALIYLGFIQQRKGDWHQAISYHLQAQALIDDRAEPMRAGQVAVGLAESFSGSGLPEKSLPHYERALQYYERHGKPYFVAFVIWAIGGTHYLLRNYPEAISNLNKALSLVKSDSLQAAQCNEYLGRVYLAQEEPTLALRYLQAALGAYLRAHNPREAAQAIALIGQSYEKQGDLKRARESYERALETFTKLTDRVNEAAVLLALGKLEQAQGNYEAADVRLRQSVDVTENIRRVSTSRDLTVALSATVYERYQSYIDCLMVRHRREPGNGFNVRAFEASELSRARSLREFLGIVQPDLISHIGPQLAEQAKSLRQSLRLKEDERIALLATAYDKNAISKLEGEMARLETENRNIDEEIKARYPSYDRIVHPAALTLEQIQRRVVTDDDLLLEYMLGEERSYLWKVSRSGISSYELPPRAQIESAARKFIDLLTANQPRPNETFQDRQKRLAQANAELPHAAAALSNLIIAPVQHELGTKRLLIVPDGILHSIPFPALTVSSTGSSANPSDGVPLLVNHEIVYEPSASTLAMVINDGTRYQVPKSLAVFANPVFDPADSRVTTPANVASEASTRKAFGSEGGEQKVSPLPASRDEAEAIMAFAPWGTGLKAMGFDANRAAVITPELAKYRIVHFATHGYVDTERPEFSYLVFSLVDRNGQPQEGHLRLHDIYNLKLSADLVVLSACNTALGKEIKGEGLIGLTRGFMHAGAGGVAASLWKVDDEATAELMTKFYEGMFRKGLTPSAAMHQAQLWMWRQQRWQAPYHWAAFIIQGRYDQTEIGAAANSRAQTLVISFGLFGAFLLAACSFLRKKTQP